MNAAQKLSNAAAPVRILVFAGCLATWWTLIIFGLTRIWGASDGIVGLSMVLLYLGFVGLLWVWGKQIYGQLRPLRFYGWDFRLAGWRELAIGWGIGSGLVMGLFLLQGGLGWLRWQALPANFLLVMGSGFLLAAAVGCAEELLFRGWLLQELEKDYSLIAALGFNSFIFACLHYLKPLDVILQTWTQFVGLMILGILLVWCRRLGQGRLGLPIGMHGGLVWGYYLIGVGKLTQATHQVPEWVTGINGNPIAGVLGLGILTGVAAMFGWRLKQQTLLRDSHAKNSGDERA